MVTTLAMKNIFPKLKINPVSYFVFLSFLCTGYIKNILLIFIIILVHECGHIFFLKCFGYEIEKVEIFPFGGVTTTSKYINSPINKDIIIYMGGVLFQAILFFCFFSCYKIGKINENTFFIFKMYNQSIFLFNLLPIRPLDGGEILLLILQKYFPFSKSLHLSIRFSMISLILFILYTVKSNLNNYIVVTFLIFQMYIIYKKRKIYIHKFLLERYIHELPYQKIEHNEVKNIDLLKKETLHFFKEKNKYIHEKEVLREKFDIQTYF